MLIPFEIRRVKNPDKSFSLIAVISMSHAVGESNTRELLLKLQNKYLEIIKNCRKQISLIQKNRKNQSNPVLHWEFGDLLFNYLQYVESLGFYFANFAQTLARDSGFSKRYLTYHLSFRKEYEKNDISPKLKFWAYQELLDISDKSKRKKCEDKLKSDEIKTRTELRKFKKFI